jgi:hypothetical protein
VAAIVPAVAAIGAAGLASPKSRLGAAVARDEDVLRLQVAMHHAARVSRGEPRGDLCAVVDRLAWRQRTVSEQVAQRAAIEQFHHRVGDGAVLAEIVDRDDVRVGQRGDGTRFGFEPSACDRIVRQRVGDDLDRDVALQSRIAGAVHLAHSAGTEQVEDFVRANSTAGLGRHAVRPL